LHSGDLSRASKRQKTKGAIVTRYHQRVGDTQPTLQRGCVHPLQCQQPYQPPSAPPTPSVNSYSYNQWQVSQPQSGGPFIPQSTQWNSADLPTPASSYGSQYASPTSSTGASQQSFFPYPAAQAYPQPLAARKASASSVEQTGPSMTREAPETSKQQSATQTLAVTPVMPSATDAEEAESWLEELKALDFPDQYTESGPVGTLPALFRSCSYLTNI
jgi:hypothetical protein